MEEATSLLRAACVQGSGPGPQLSVPHGSLFLLLAIVQPSASCDAAPHYESDCHDGSDNDGDGETDCADPDCMADRGCEGPSCGDGSCEGDETPETCATDCGSPNTVTLGMWAICSGSPSSAGPGVVEVSVFDEATGERLLHDATDGDSLFCGPVSLDTSGTYRVELYWLSWSSDEVECFAVEEGVSVQDPRWWVEVCWCDSDRNEDQLPYGCPNKILTGTCFAWEPLTDCWGP